MVIELSVPLHQSYGTVYHPNLKMLIQMIILKLLEGFPFLVKLVDCNQLPVFNIPTFSVNHF